MGASSAGVNGRICVFAGSRAGARSEYAEAARRLARALVARHYGLVYGGGNVGLMGVVADAVLEHGGHVTGVIPEPFVVREVAHRGLSELRIVQSMHERKAVMAELSDAFIALPGGIGTMEEFFEVLSWAQLGIHQKPCGLLNVCDYYRPIVEFLDYALQADFLKPSHRALLIVEDRAEALLDRFEKYAAPELTRWFDRSKT
ncbi:MAG TPA: TIGR00730 family Rossman fold protein [Candidatus Acidoferrales bacterium]|nr:TIGR00730 family Rossman fold protein [Candidatus Acidoferrales bacterium]